MFATPKSGVRHLKSSVCNEKVLIALCKVAFTYLIMLRLVRKGCDCPSVTKLVTKILTKILTEMTKGTQLIKQVFRHKKQLFDTQKQLFDM